ncbi:MAG: hypothetical protein U0R51_10495 [Solirubrobacterales bacterium]
MPLSALTRPARRWLWAADQPPSTPVERVEPSPAILSESGLPAIDYADAFAATTGAATATRDAEAWAREFLEGAPLRVRLSLLGGWTGLGLRLDPRPGTDRVLGWRVRRREPDVVVLGAESVIGLEGELIVTRDRETVTLSTVVRTRTRVAEEVWRRVVPSHLGVVPNVLGLRKADAGAATGP